MRYYLSSGAIASQACESAKNGLAYLGSEFLREIEQVHPFSIAIKEVLLCTFCLCKSGGLSPARQSKGTLLRSMQPVKKRIPPFLIRLNPANKLKSPRHSVAAVCTLTDKNHRSYRCKRLPATVIDWSIRNRSSTF